MLALNFYFTMRLKIFLSLVLYSIVFIGSFAQKSPVGYAIYTSNCASGGFDYYFFADKKVVAVWALGESANPVDGGIYKGTWELNSKGEVSISYQYAVNFVPAKNAKVVAVAAQTIYDLYEPKILQNPDVTDLLKLTTIKEGEEGCESTKKHNYIIADNFFSTCLASPIFKNQYPFTASKILLEQDVARYNKSELEIMRNEIFARYNYAFQNPKWKTFFAKKGSANSIANVDALLSDIEKANLETIKAAEAKKKK